jgi:hypothetical protein
MRTLLATIRAALLVAFIGLVIVAAAAIAAVAVMLPAAAATRPHSTAGHHKVSATFGRRSVTPASATHTVTTDVELEPDSGYFGPAWEYDTYAQTFTWQRGAQVPAAECGSRALRCYQYSWSLRDTGIGQTIAGAASPAAETPLDVVETTQLSGTMSGSYLSSYLRVYTQYVPARLDLYGTNPAGNYQPQLWFALAQPGSYEVNQTASSYAWAFHYDLPAGGDGLCPGYSGAWTDAATDPAPGIGNILAPNAADCAAQS